VHGRSERRRWQLRLDLHRLAGAGGPDADFNAALLELGTRICRPMRPACGECPLEYECLTARSDTIEADEGEQRMIGAEA
jgi:A/G-specific adenine glycosylase